MPTRTRGYTIDCYPLTHCRLLSVGHNLIRIRRAREFTGKHGRGGVTLLEYVDSGGDVCRAETLCGNCSHKIWRKSVGQGLLLRRLFVEAGLATGNDDGAVVEYDEWTRAACLRAETVV